MNGARRGMQGFAGREMPTATIKTEAKMGICPYCGRTIEAVTGVSLSNVGPTIAAGSYLICAYCCELMCYDGTIFAQVSPEEAARVLESNPLWSKLRDAVARYPGDVPKPDKVQ